MGAGAPWLLQVDADIEVAPGLLAALLRQQADGGAGGYDLVSIMALLPVAGVWQRLLLPAYVWFFMLLYPFRLANGPNPRFAAAAGGCILLRRRLLEKIGGYAAVRHAVIDDCALATACKRAGGRTWVGLSRQVVSHRASESLRDVADLVARTAYTQLRHSPLLLLVVSGLLVFAFWLPPVLLLLPGMAPLTRIGAGLAWLAMAAAYVPLLRFYRLLPLWAVALPLVATLYLGMTWLSAWRHWRGIGASWKGRNYQNHTMRQADMPPPVPVTPVAATTSAATTNPQPIASISASADAASASEAAPGEMSLSEMASYRPRADSPVFIIGSPRSGTSVLHWSLLQHPALWGSEESEFMLPLARARKSSYDSGIRYGEHAWLVQQKVGYAEYCAAIGSGIDRLYRSRSGGLAWVEQTPAYSTIAAELAMLFPQARFLFIHRDGRKVNESMRRMWQWDVAEAAQAWVAHNQFCLELLADNPQRVHRFAYEALVADPKAVFQDIFAFLHLDYTAEATRFLRDRAPINVSPGTETESGQAKLALRQDDWQPEQVEEFWHHAGAMMARLSYDRD